VTRLLWDASALVKSFADEEGSETAAKLFDGFRLAHSVTYLGYAETAAVLLRKFNRGTLIGSEFRQARQNLYDAVLLSPRFELVTVGDADILDGMALTDRHNINTSDAAILTAYLRLIRSPGDDKAFLVVSDHRLERAARAEGLSTLDPARTSPEDLASLGLA
jgi:predicted nucleic acid-binding protein